ISIQRRQRGRARIGRDKIKLWDRSKTPGENVGRGGAVRKSQEARAPRRITPPPLLAGVTQRELIERAGGVVDDLKADVRHRWGRGHRSQCTIGGSVAAMTSRM